MQGRVLSVQVGRVAPLDDAGHYSAIDKRAVAGPVHAGPLGLEGDQQADLAHHGGPEKAVYGYPAAHYPRWAAEYPCHAARLRAGGFGENLTIEGACEETVHLGDVLAVGSAELVACQPRQPCSTLALYYGDRTIGRTMTQTGRSGWYFRVSQPGAIAAGDLVELRARPNPAWPFARFLARLRTKTFTPEELAELAVMTGLAQQWRRQAARMLERQGARA